MPQGVHSVEAALVGLDEKKNFSEGVTFSSNSVIVRFLGFDPIEGSARRVSTRNAARMPRHPRKDGRVVDCTALERRHTEIPYRGFESLSFRQI